MMQALKIAEATIVIAVYAYYAVGETVGKPYTLSWDTSVGI